jgi:hypothetical protein
MTKDKFAELDDGPQSQGKLKAGLFGKGKTGKTYTAALMAVAVKRQSKLEGPIAIWDTEGGSQYLKPLILRLTKQKLLARRERRFDGLVTWLQQCKDAGVAVAIVDSITHPWRELCDSYLAQLNEARRQANRSTQARLSFQDWGVVKPRWAKWTDLYLNIGMHVITCARGGDIWEFVEDDRGKKELRTVGTKMKTEGEFQFEPGLIVELESEVRQEGRVRIGQAVTVIGDRFAAMHGARRVFYDTGDAEKNLAAVSEFFMPHLALLQPGDHSTVDTDGASAFEFDIQGDDEAMARKKTHDILLEEIKHVMLKRWPAQTGADKMGKALAIEAVFGTGSWAQVEALGNTELSEGLKKMKVHVAKENDSGDEASKGV